MGIPCVVIAGRPNVGKSSLFNAIVGDRVSIVEPTPGVTRNRITRVLERDGKRFELVDTGGLGLVDSVELAADIHQQIEVALAHADLVLLVVDVKAGLQPMDEEITRRLRRPARKCCWSSTSATPARTSRPRPTSTRWATRTSS